MSTLSQVTSFYNSLTEKKSPLFTVEQFGDVVKETLYLPPHVVDHHEPKAQTENEVALTVPRRSVACDNEQELGDRMVIWKYKRKEILLLLSCLKELFEQKETNPASSAGTEKCKGDHSGSNVVILEKLKQINILSLLLQHVSSEDLFISYESTKVIMYAFKCNHFQELRDTFIEEVITGVLHSSKASYLDLLSHLMANRQGEITNAWCCQALRSSTLFQPDFLTNVLSFLDIGKTKSQLLLLSLIQKTVKYNNKLPEGHKHLQEWFSPIESLLLTFLSNCLRKIDLKQGRLVCKKILNIFNTVLQYGSDLTEEKTIPDIYVCTARNVLSVISPAVVLSVPYVCQFVGFGGTEVEAADVTDRRGDLAFLRKLFMVLIKSCAIVVRSGSPNIRDKESFSLCASLDSMTTFVQKTFEQNFAKLAWLPLIFADQDDAWIEVLLCLLDAYLNSLSVSYLHREMICPHIMFLQFLDSSSRDHVVIVDLLTSPETCFLVYFLRYLKCVLNEWNKFVEVCHGHYCSGQTTVSHGLRGKEETKPSEPSSSLDKRSEDIHALPGLGAYCDNESSTESEQDDETGPALVFNTGSTVKIRTIVAEESHKDRDLSPHIITLCSPRLDCDQKSDCLPLPPGVYCDLQCVEMVFSTFIRVRLRIERLVAQDLFPYNPRPLLNLIEQCESLYENTESAVQVT